MHITVLTGAIVSMIGNKTIIEVRKRAYKSVRRSEEGCFRKNLIHQSRTREQTRKENNSK